MSNFTNYRITHSLFCLFNHNTHPFDTRDRERYQNNANKRFDWWRMCLRKQREKLFLFEENNYIIEPRQMLKYFVWMLGLLDEWSHDHCTGLKVFRANGANVNLSASTLNKLYLSNDDIIVVRASDSRSSKTGSNVKIPARTPSSQNDLKSQLKIKRRRKKFFAQKRTKA